MGKYFKLLVVIFLLIGCTKDEDILPIKEYTFTIDSVLNKSGTSSLYKDNNGYFHLKLSPANNQTIHRVTGRILVNGKEPVPAEKVEWESNLYWYLKRGDTLATITKTYINYYKGKLDTIVLPPLISNKTEIVPTINPASYSGKRGEINIMIAPIYRMKGDTMLIQAYNHSSNQTKFLKIVLE